MPLGLLHSPLVIDNLLPAC